MSKPPQQRREWSPGLYLVIVTLVILLLSLADWLGLLGPDDFPLGDD